VDFLTRINEVLHHDPPDQVPFAPYDNLVPRGQFSRELRNRGMGLCVRLSTLWNDVRNVGARCFSRTGTRLARMKFDTSGGSAGSDIGLRKTGRAEDGVGASAAWKLVVLLLVLWSLLSTASFYVLAVPRQERFDFYPIWVGSRAVLRGENPYSQGVTLSIQQGMFGRYLEPDEDQQRFAYTPIIAWLLLPFWLMPFPLAVSLWCGLQMLVLLVVPLLTASLLRWRIRPGVLLVTSILGYRYPVNAYLLGQFIPFSLACIVVTLWGITRNKSVLSGCALVLAMVRPEIVVMPVIVLLFLAWQAKQRKTVLIWLLAVIALCLLTRLWIGPWEAEFIAGIRAYAEYASLVWPPALTGNVWLAWFLVIAVLCWGAWMWLTLHPLRHFSRPVWAVSVAVLIGLMILPQTGNYSMVLALLPIWLMLWTARRKLIRWMPIVAVLLLPWVFHVAFDVPTLEHLVVPLVISTGLSICWYLWKKPLATAASDSAL